MENERDLTVALDTKLTPELVEEGFVREIISKLQTMRREANFNVTDRIKVYVAGNDKLAGIIKNNEETIKGVVLANEIICGEIPAALSGKDWNINGEDIALAVER